MNGSDDTISYGWLVGHVGDNGKSTLIFSTFRCLSENWKQELSISQTLLPGGLEIIGLVFGRVFPDATSAEEKVRQVLQKTNFLPSRDQFYVITGVNSTDGTSYILLSNDVGLVQFHVRSNFSFRKGKSKGRNIKLTKEIY
jgi:hypothetical protein